MAKAKKTTKTKKASKSFSLGVKGGKYQAVGGAKLKDKDIKSEREKSIGQHIGYRYDVNLIPDYKKLTPFLKKYIETMGWDDLNWLEDVHMGYEGDKPAVTAGHFGMWKRTANYCRSTPCVRRFGKPYNQV